MVCFQQGSHSTFSSLQKLIFELALFSFIEIKNAFELRFPDQPNIFLAAATPEEKNLWMAAFAGLQTSRFILCQLLYCYLMIIQSCEILQTVSLDFIYTQKTRLLALVCSKNCLTNENMKKNVINPFIYLPQNVTGIRIRCKNIEQPAASSDFEILRFARL